MRELRDELPPKADVSSYNTQTSHIQDCPGHNHGNATDAHMIEPELSLKLAKNV